MNNQSRFVMRGDRVSIRFPHKHDQDEFVSLRQRSRAHLEPWEPILDGIDSFGDECFDRELSSCHTDREQRWLIIENETNQIVGRIALGNIERGPFNNGRFGYWIGAGFEGRGYMLEAMQLAIAHAFRSEAEAGLGLHRVCANVIPRNTRSSRLLERLGFVKEGYSKGYLQIQGVYEDHERWAMTVERVSQE